MKDFYQLSERGRAVRLRAVAHSATVNYPLEFSRLSLISNSQNGIFRLDTRTGKRFVMRVCLPLPQVADTVRLEAAWLSALAAETELRVPQVIPTRSGDACCWASAAGVPEERCCVLFSWLPGLALDRRLNQQNMRGFGALAARLHEHAAHFRLPAGLPVRYRYDRAFPFEEPVRLFEPEYSHLLPPARLEVFKYALDLVEKSIERLKTSGEPLRLLHGDLHRWNVKVYRNRLGVLDFEDLMLGWPVQDIGTTLLYFYGDKDYLSHREAFCEGYTTIAPWPEREPGEVDAFIAARNLVLADTLLQASLPEWQEMAPRYFARVERRLRALLWKEGEFNSEDW